MESRSTRHRVARAQRRRRTRWLLAGVAACGVGAATVIGVTQATGEPGSGPGASALAPCADAVAVTVSGLAADRATGLVASIAAGLGGDCAAVRIAGPDEQDRAVRLGPPGSVVPTDTSTASADPPASTVATSPILLAMPTEMAAALGAPALDTPTLRSLLTDATPWKDRGHPEWGAFTIDAPDPSTTAVGAAAFAGLATVANGAPPDGTLDYAAPSAGDFAVIKLEHSLRTDLRADATLPTPATVTDSAEHASAFVTTEADLARYAAADPAVPMTGFPVAGGASVLEWTVSAAGVTDPETRRRTTAVTAALATDAGRAALAAAGLRPPGGPTPTVLPPGVTPASLPAPPHPLTPQERSTIAAQWSLMRTRISTLVVLDTSGSMRTPMPGAETPKIDVVRALAAQSYKVASPKARSGIWTFRADAQGDPVIERIALLQPNDTPVGTVPHSVAATAALAEAEVGGGTPLFEAIRTAYDDATKNYDPAYVNQVLVLTDGKNEESSSTLTERQLRAHLAKTFRTDRPVRIVAIAFDPGDLTVLTRVVAGTGGTAVSAQTMEQVPEAVRVGLFGG